MTALQAMNMFSSWKARNWINAFNKLLYFYKKKKQFLFELCVGLYKKLTSLICTQ